MAIVDDCNDCITCTALIVAKPIPKTCNWGWLSSPASRNIIIYICIYSYDIWYGTPMHQYIPPGSFWTYIYIYTYTYTWHTHIYIYIFIYIYLVISGKDNLGKLTKSWKLKEKTTTERHLDPPWRWSSGDHLLDFRFHWRKRRSSRARDSSALKLPSGKLSHKTMENHNF